MNLAVIYIDWGYIDYFYYLERSAVDQIVILQIGKGEIYRELGKCFVILDTDTKKAVSLAKDFIDGQRVEKLFILGPPDFVQKAKISFQGLADEIYIYPP